VSVRIADVHKYLLDDILWPTEHGTPYGYSKLWKGMDSTLKYSRINATKMFEQNMQV